MDTTMIPPYHEVRKMIIETSKLMIGGVSIDGPQNMYLDTKVIKAH